MVDSLSVEELTFRVRWSSRRRTVGITVRPDGELVVAAPVGCRTRRLEAVVQAKLPWVRRKLAEMAARPAAPDASLRRRRAPAVPGFLLPAVPRRGWRRARPPSPRPLPDGAPGGGRRPSPHDRVVRAASRPSARRARQPLLAHRRRDAGLRPGEGPRSPLGHLRRPRQAAVPLGDRPLPGAR